MKLKIFLVLLLAVVYYLVTYCVLSPGICRYYVDYYILYQRSFSLDEERDYLRRKVNTKVNYVKEYPLRVSPDTFKFIGAAPEGNTGLWSNGNTVMLSFELPNASRNVTLDFDVMAYTNAKNRRVDVTIFHDNRQIGEWHFEYGRKLPKTKLRIAKKYLKDGRPVDLMFKIEGIASPQSLGYSSETKKFGLIFNSLKITPYGK